MTRTEWLLTLGGLLAVVLVGSILVWFCVITWSTVAAGVLGAAVASAVRYVADRRHKSNQ
jgi:hypothetical protein